MRPRAALTRDQRMPSASRPCRAGGGTRRRRARPFDDVFMLPLERPPASLPATALRPPARPSRGSGGPGRLSRVLAGAGRRLLRSARLPALSAALLLLDAGIDLF